KLGYKPDGSKAGVKIIKQGFNVDPILQKQADCVSTMAYNEYWQVIDGGYKPSQLVVFKYEDEGVATLEDGLWVLEKNLKDPAFVTKMAKFVKASMKGLEPDIESTTDGRRSSAALCPLLRRKFDRRLASKFHRWDASSSSLLDSASRLTTRRGAAAARPDGRCGLARPASGRSPLL